MDTFEFESIVWDATVDTTVHQGPVELVVYGARRMGRWKRLFRKTKYFEMLRYSMDAPWKRWFMATNEKVVLNILVVQGAVTLCEMKVKLYKITGDGLMMVQQAESGCLTVVLSRT